MTTATTTMRSGFLPNRIIHLHPTRLCNLACLHCYSTSGPKERAALELDVLKKALLLLKAEGYNQVSLSGGEPMTYPQLVPLIDFARTQDYKVTMITNGMFPVKKLEEVIRHLDGAAISFDGLAPMHNRLRGKPDAFEKASAALAHLCNADIPVAAAVSLTSEAIADLPDLAYHLAEMGARAIQVRPVALAGRARMLSDIRNYNAADRARLYLVIMALQEELKDMVRVHSDLVPARSIWAQKDDYASLLGACAVSGNGSLSDLVNPLVITETGNLKPIAYDFNDDYNITCLADLQIDTLQDYKRNRVGAFRELIGRGLVALQQDRGLIDWFDYCTRRSEAKMEMLS